MRRNDADWRVTYKNVNFFKLIDKKEIYLRSNFYNQRITSVQRKAKGGSFVPEDVNTKHFLRNSFVIAKKNCD